MPKTEIIYIGIELEQQLFKRFIAAIKRHKSVSLGKFGIFRLHKMKSRRSLDVNTQKPITIKAQNTIKFKPSAAVRRLVQ